MLLEQRRALRPLKSGSALPRLISAAASHHLRPPDQTQWTQVRPVTTCSEWQRPFSSDRREEVHPLVGTCGDGAFVFRQPPFPKWQWAGFGIWAEFGTAQ